MKNKKAALYDPFFDTLGGGEKYVLSILKVLEDQGYEVSVFWDTDLSKDVESRYRFGFKKLIFEKNIFNGSAGPVDKLKRLRDYDVLLYVTDGSYFFSTAKINIIHTMVPDKKLYKMNALNKAKLHNWRFITHSEFTRKFLTRWGVKSTVLFPYLDEKLINSTGSLVRKKQILTVGRFFSHLHAKKHDEIIKTFRRNKKYFPGFTLILAGGLQDADADYYKSLLTLAEGDKDIVFKTNVTFAELLTLYKESLIYLHFAGFGIDPNTNPELVEHFGITPLEAMAAGCIPFVYNAGGPAEIIRNGKTGFLFDSETELIQKMKNLIADTTLQGKLREDARLYVKYHFSYDSFADNVKKLLGIS